MISIAERMTALIERALRQISAIGVPSSACFNANAVCASVNFDAFTEFCSWQGMRKFDGNRLSPLWENFAKVLIVK